MKITVTPEEVQGAILKAVKDDDKLKKLTNLNPHSVWMLVVNAVGKVFAYFANMIIAYVFDSIFPLTCSRYVLTRHLAEEGLEFKKARKATVVVRAGSTTKPEMEIPIPQGTIIRTPGDNGKAFEITDGGSINQSTPTDSKGYYTIELNAEAVLEGSVYNVPAESITEFESSVDDIDVVYNPEASSGGADEESNEDATKRLRDAKQVRQRGIKEWFKVETEKITGVKQAYVIPRYAGRGTVGILALGYGGDVSDSVLQTIEARFNTDEEDPAGAFHVVAGRPKKFVQNYNIIVWYAKGTAAPADSELTDRLNTHIIFLGLGEKQIIAIIAAWILGLGLRDVQIVTPASNVMVPSDCLSELGNVIWDKREYDV